MRGRDNLASLLNRRVILWENAVGGEKNALGQYPQEDRPVCTVWAHIRPQTGSLLSGRIADTAISRTTHKLTLRYRAGLHPDMWVMANGERYNILYILDPYMAHERLELFCEVQHGG